MGGYPILLRKLYSVCPKTSFLYAFRRNQPFKLFIKDGFRLKECRKAQETQ
jgi:hypothetical protein